MAERRGSRDVPGGALSETRADEAHLTRRRQAVGLLLIAAILLALILFRAPAHMLFPPGWWRF